MRKVAAAASIAALVCGLSGCAAFSGALRPDFDDEHDSSQYPVRGGLWAERGLLDENDPGSLGPDDYGTVGHHDRSPAAYQSHSRGRGSWVSEDQRAASERDRFRRSFNQRDPASFSATPQLAPSVRRQYRAGGRATRDDFLDHEPNEGSLWASDGQTNYFFTKNKVRAEGDILSVVIEDGLVRDIAQEVTRTLTAKEREIELEAAQIRLAQKAAVAGGDRAGATQAAPERAPAQAQTPRDRQEVPPARLSDIDVGPALGVKAGEFFMAEIIQRYPNGNYKIRGTKRIPYRGGTKLVSLLGIIKGSDIGDDETVASGKMYEYRVEHVQ